ncbi:MAG: YceI family protein [Betaproteobacteria bacterium]|nr:YceI family protein [Betaproteobacteria bacterium]
MKKSLLFAAATAIAIPFAQATEFGTLLTDKSTLSFVSKQMGVPVDGSFKRFKATLAFDPAKPQSGSTSFDLDMASIDAGSQEANDEVADAKWFNLKQYPRASFKSSAIKPLGNNRFELHGALTIKGTSKDVVAPASFKQDGVNGVFDGAFTLKRLDFKIGEGEWADTSTVADEVQIKFHLVAAPKR